MVQAFVNVAPRFKIVEGVEVTIDGNPAKSTERRGRLEVMPEVPSRRNPNVQNSSENTVAPMATPPSGCEPAA